MQDLNIGNGHLYKQQQYTISLVRYKSVAYTQGLFIQTYYYVVSIKINKDINVPIY